MHKEPISIEQVTKYIHKPRTRCILSDYTAVCAPACITVVTGASGVGKSTLLSCITGLSSIDAGRVVYAGQVLHDISDEQLSHMWLYRMGMVFQSPCLLSELSVSDNIALKGYIARAHPADTHARVLELLDEVGLTAHASAYPEELSGGQQQRVALARALFHTPDYVIADEPTAHLDQMHADMLMRVLMRYRDMHGCGMIIATHDERVIQHADVRQEVLSQEE